MPIRHYQKGLVHKKLNVVMAKSLLFVEFGAEMKYNKPFKDYIKSADFIQTLSINLDAWLAWQLGTELKNIFNLMPDQIEFISQEILCLINSQSDMVKSLMNQWMPFVIRVIDNDNVNELKLEIPVDLISHIANKLDREYSKFRRSYQLSHIDETLREYIKSKISNAIKREAFKLIVCDISGIKLDVYFATGRHESQVIEALTLEEFHKLINTTKLPFQHNYDEILEFSGGLAPVRRGRKWGYINTDLQEIISCQFDICHQFRENAAAAVCKDGDWGAINKKGDVIISLIHGKCTYFSNGMCAFNVFPKRYHPTEIWKYYNEKGEQVYEGCWHNDLDPHDFNEGYAVVKGLGDEEHIIDRSGKIISRKVYGIWMHYFSNGLIKYLGCGKFGFKNPFDRIVIQPIYDKVGFFNEGLCIVKRDNRWFIINKTGAEISILSQLDNPTYEYYFSEGLASVEYNERIGFINTKGEISIPFEYYNSFRPRFKNGFVPLMDVNKKWGLVDKFGTTRIPFIYEEIGELSEGLVAIRQNGMWGYADSSGRIIVDCIYESASLFNNGISIVKLNGKYGVLKKEWIDSTI